MSQTEAISTKIPQNNFQQRQSVEQTHVSRDTWDRDAYLAQVKVPTWGTMGNHESTPRVEPIFKSAGKNVGAPKSHRYLGQHLHRGTHLLGAALSTPLSPLPLFYQLLRHTGTVLQSQCRRQSHKLQCVSISHLTPVDNIQTPRYSSTKLPSCHLNLTIPLIPPNSLWNGTWNPDPPT